MKLAACTRSHAGLGGKNAEEAFYRQGIDLFGDDGFLGRGEVLLNQRALGLYDDFLPLNHGFHQLHIDPRSLSPWPQRCR